jgi:hypothetical protein
MTKNDLKEKVEGLINIKGISIHTISVIEILDIFLDENVSESMCEKVKLLLKKMLIENSKIEQQAGVGLASKIETFCNKYSPQ